MTNITNEKTKDIHERIYQKETIYWLRIIGDTNSSFEEEAMRLKREGKEILNVVSTIIYNTKHGRK